MCNATGSLALCLRANAAITKSRQQLIGVVSWNTMSIVGGGGGGGGGGGDTWKV